MEWFISRGGSSLSRSNGKEWIHNLDPVIILSVIEVFAVENIAAKPSCRDNDGGIPIGKTIPNC